MGKLPRNNKVVVLLREKLFLLNKLTFNASHWPAVNTFLWLGCELVLALICTEEQHDATRSTVKWRKQDTCPQMWAYTVSFLSYCAMERGECWSESCVQVERKEGECALQLSLFVKQRLLILCLRLCGCRIGAKSGGTVTWLQWTRFHPKFQDDNPDRLFCLLVSSAHNYDKCGSKEVAFKKIWSVCTKNHTRKRPKSDSSDLCCCINTHC